MKRLLLALALLAPFTLPQTGCQNVPAQTQAVATLKAVGYAGKAVIDGARELRKQGVITEAKWTRIAHFYDNDFQPNFRAAVKFAKGNINAAAPVEMTALLKELQDLAK